MIELEKLRKQLDKLVIKRDEIASKFFKIAQFYGRCKYIVIEWEYTCVQREIEFMYPERQMRPFSDPYIVNIRKRYREDRDNIIKIIDREKNSKLNPLKEELNTMGEQYKKLVSMITKSESNRDVKK